MTKSIARTVPVEDVDRIVDGLLSDPKRIDDVKALLRRQLSDSRVVHLRSRPRYRAATRDEIDDMWDNVPV